MRYDTETFIELVMRCGYGSTNQARIYCNHHKKEDYGDEDFMQIHRSREDALSKTKANESKWYTNKGAKTTKRLIQTGTMGNPARMFED